MENTTSLLKKIIENLYKENQKLKSQLSMLQQKLNYLTDIDTLKNAFDLQNNLDNLKRILGDDLIKYTGEEFVTNHEWLKGE